MKIRAAVIAGCLSAAVSLADTPVALSVWFLPRPEDTSIQARSFREVLRGFRRRYPHIELTSPSGLVIPEMSGMDTKPLMAIAGGVSPDVIFINFRQADTYVREGFLLPLDVWYDALPAAERRERVLPQIEPVIRREGPDGQTHVWALPYGTYVRGLCWRKDVFQAAGLDPERPPANWDELLAMARRCTNPDAGTWGLVWPRSAHWSANFYSYLCSAGAQALAHDPVAGWRAAFDSPAAVDAYAFTLRLLQAPWSDPVSGRVLRGVVYRESDGPLLWAQGRIAMMERYFTDDMLADVNPELVGLAPVPAAPGGRRASELNAVMCGIFSGAARKGRATVEAAWAYVHYLGGAEARAIRTRVLVENGYGLFANPRQLERLGYDDYLRRIPPAWRETYDVALAHGEPEPHGRNCQMVYHYMARPADRMLLENLGRDVDAPAHRARIAQLLGEAVARANERMLGTVPPVAATFRRRVAGVVALGMLAAFCLLMRVAARAFALPAVAAGPAPRRRRLVWLLLAPALLTILVWRYLPLIWGGLMAFQDYRLMLPARWTGLDNLAAVLWDPEFWQSLRASLVYTALSVLLGFATPIALALLLDEIPRGRTLFRLLYYLPAVVSGLVVMLLWKQLYDPAPTGALNRLLAMLTPPVVLGLGLAGALLAALAALFQARARRRGAALVWTALAAGAAALTGWLLLRVPLPPPPQRWLEQPTTALVAVVLPLVWAGVGPGCLIYLAALKTIPAELHEAAALDGASFFARLRHVTFPGLKVLILMNLVGAVVHAFQSAEYVLAMTGGGPAGATQVLALKIFFDAFVFLRFGFASASAWLLGSLLLGFTVLQLRRLAQVEFRATAATEGRL